MSTADHVAAFIATALAVSNTDRARLRAHSYAAWATAREADFWSWYRSMVAEAGLGTEVTAATAMLATVDDDRLTQRTARNAVIGLILRDHLSPERYLALTGTWRTLVGPVHPDDPELTRRASVR